jgi:hypothetical protein
VEHLYKGEVIGLITVCIVYIFTWNVSQMDDPLRCCAILALSSIILYGMFDRPIFVLYGDMEYFVQ